MTPTRIFLTACLMLTLGDVAYSQARPAGAAETIANQASSALQAPDAIGGSDLARELRQGGYIIYFRHTATDFSKSDAGMKGYEDCANQRMLSEAGREAARRIGRDVRALGLPVTSVLASPYCRTMETAKLAFLQAEPRVEIRESEGGEYAGLKRLLSTPVQPHANVWVVGHGTPFRAIAGPPHLAEGEAAVIKPTGTSWKVVARLPQEAWSTLPMPPRAK